MKLNLLFSLVLLVLLSGCGNQAEEEKGLGLINNIPPKPTPSEQLEPETPGSQKQAVEKFYNYINRRLYTEAVNLMEGSSYEKEVWKDNFRVVKSVKVVNVLEHNTKQWTEEKQYFKVFLDVTTNNVEDKKDWQEGENIRWLSLQKKDDFWLIYNIELEP